MRVVSLKQAVSKGKTRYFTGKACKNGHTAPRKVANRQCVVCQKARMSASYRRHHAKIKAEARARVGTKCACCGERRQVFLTIHHRKGDGSVHRTAWGNGPRYSRWILRQPLTELRRHLEVLCANCHLAFTIVGHCPHRPKRGLNAA